MQQDATRQTLGTLITWMAQSANSPISLGEAGKLLKMLEPDPPVAPNPAEPYHSCPVCGVIRHPCEHLVPPMPAESQRRRMQGTPCPKDKIIHQWCFHELEHDEDRGEYGCALHGCVPVAAKVCPTCCGCKQVRTAGPVYPSYFVTYTDPCPECGGSGEVPVEVCQRCDGRGRVRVMKPVYAVEPFEYMPCPACGGEEGR
jgi:hypothetical protein